MIRRLIELGADVRAKDHDGNPTLKYFIDFHDALALLLEAGASLKAFERTHGSAILRAISSGRSDGATIRLLLEHGAKRPIDRRRKRNAWHAAAARSCGNAAFRRGIHEIVQEIATLDLPINARDDQGRTPLWIALEHHVREVDRIGGWDDGAFVPMRGRVYFYNHHETAMLLLKHGADPNAVVVQSPHVLIPKGGTPLMVRRYDQPELHAAMLRHGADPLARCTEGKTALDYAMACAASERYDRKGAAKVVAMFKRAEKEAMGGRRKDG